jgi:DNA invertase Pin-like site-specific DNA recombinase
LSSPARTPPWLTSCSSVMGAFAEFERSLIRERQREGIALAKQRGAYKGRKMTLAPERAAELVQRALTGVPKAVLDP